MKKIVGLLFCTTCLNLILTTHCTSKQNETQNKSQKSPQVIVLKLDDVVASDAVENLPVPPRWQRVTEFFKESNIKASYGVIGYSLEEENKAYFDWIKELHKSGLIEFWNHGYRQKKSGDEAGEFENDSVEKQRFALERTQTLGRERLGIEFRIFGAHWSGTNETTARALSSLPQIRMVFYSPEDKTRFVFERVLTLENPVHVPDFAKFKDSYEGVGRDEEVLALQGHPNSWDDERWEEFKNIIAFLQSKGAVFMTPSEYLAKIKS